MNDLKMTWITGWDEIYSAEVQQIWLNHFTLDATATVFQHPQMGMTWLDAYRHNRDLKPLFCLMQNRFQSILYPLVMWCRNGRNAHQRLVIPVGFSDFDYLNPLVISSENTAFPADYYAIITHELTHKFRADAVQLTGISRSVKDMHYAEMFTRQICPLLHLNRFDGFDGFVANLKASLRGDINRQCRNLARMGGVSLHLYRAHETDEMCLSLSELLAHRALRWPHAYSVEGFYPRLVHNMATGGLLHFSELRVNNEVLSRHLGFVFRNRFYYYLPASSPLYSHFSPGKIHLFYLHKWAFDNGIAIFDHLRGDETYKRQWADSFECVNGLRIENRRPISLIKNSWVDVKDKINVLLT